MRPTGVASGVQWAVVAVIDPNRLVVQLGSTWYEFHDRSVEWKTCVR